jgi:hypothetical protein
MGLIAIDNDNALVWISLQTGWQRGESFSITDGLDSGRAGLLLHHPEHHGLYPAAQ